MKVIGFEEHYKLPAIGEEHQNAATGLLKEAGYGSPGAEGEWPPGINDLGEGRVAAMDAAGVDMQILSHSVPGPETLEPARAAELARRANDAVVAAIGRHPDRFRGFAALPMRDPAAAAAELERTVRDHGFVGALINGHINGRYLDDTFFWPVFESAETLGVPIFLHPTMPPQPVIDAYYAGFDPKVSARLAGAGVGWHLDTGVHCLRLILGGVFDRFPRLQIVVGHHFEALSWMGWRTDYSFTPEVTGLKRTVKEYLRENFYGGILAGDFFTQEPGAMDPSWSLSFNAYLAMVNVIGIDRVVFTADYPYGNINACRQFLDRMPISEVDREKIAHRNAERLLRL
ncbi:amidohydrolase family protein [Mycobacterium sp. 4858]|uniref:amidohydrolase family protein n=1 Tax=Mycobacterium sp. 4858 TaxID=2057185 RepID=UPI0018ED9F38|nr:amidohydrolase family protein [Mycobacterium sp. 4858]